MSLRPVILGALALAGLLLLGVPLLPALMIAAIPVISGLVDAGTNFTYSAAILLLAAGIAWKAAPLIVGQDQFDSFRRGVARPG